jgi:hypothetical protein
MHSSARRIVLAPDPARNDPGGLPVRQYLLDLLDIQGSLQRWKQLLNARALLGSLRGRSLGHRLGPATHGQPGWTHGHSARSRGLGAARLSRLAGDGSHPGSMR